MIGVYLKYRRHEFLEFANKYVIDYTEIFDIEDIEYLETLDKLFVDAPIDMGALPVIEVGDHDLAEVFRDYIQCEIDSTYVSRSKLLYAADKYYTSLIPTDLPTITVLPLAVEEEDISARQEPVMIESSPIEIPVEPSTPVIDTSTLIDIFNSPPPEPEPAPAPAPAPVLTPTTQQLFEPEPEPIVQPQEQGYESETSFFGSLAETESSHTSLTRPSNVGHLQVTGNTQNRIVAQRCNGAISTVRPKGLKYVSREFQMPIIAFSSISDKAGVSCITYLLAHVLADQHPDAKILYLDLNLSNPNSIFTLLNLYSDATVMNIASLSEDEFLKNISLLTETLSLGSISISAISLGEASFGVKRKLVDMNFEPFLRQLTNCFDLVLVDLGKIQATLGYQFKILQSKLIHNIALADGSNKRTVTTFMTNIQDISHTVDIIVNKNVPQSGSFVITQKYKQPLGSIGMYRNVDAMVTGRLAFEGTAIYNELSALGGIL